MKNHTLLGGEELQSETANGRASKTLGRFGKFEKKREDKSEINDNQRVCRFDLGGKLVEIRRTRKLSSTLMDSVLKVDWDVM